MINENETDFDDYKLNEKLDNALHTYETIRFKEHASRREKFQLKEW